MAGKSLGYEGKIWKPLYLIGTCVIGSLFGLAIYKSTVFVPKNVQNQFLFLNWIMVKVFMSAVSVGMILFSLMSIYDSDGFEYIQSQKYSIMKRGFIPSIIGGLILGVGLALSGSCPGIILIQVGINVKYTIFTLIGCYLGGFIYEFFSKSIDGLLVSNSCQYPPTINKLYNRPYHQIAIPLSIVIIIGLAILELLHPNYLDISSAIHGDLSVKYWHPYLSGTLIGFVQILSSYFIGTTIGGSWHYICTLSLFSECSNNLKDARKGSWRNFYFALGSLALSYMMSYRTNIIDIPNSTVNNILGGMCLLIGARIARGCTSGNGISGMSLLSTAGIVTSIFMFVGAIPTAILLHNM